MEKFLAEWHLQRVGKWLTLFGYPTKVVPKLTKENFLKCSYGKCTVLTTSKRWINTFNRYRIPYLILPNTEDWKTQLCMVLKHFNIPLRLNLNFCPECLFELKPVDREEVKGKIPYYSYKCGKSFKVCPNCGKIYWIGGHQKLMEKTIKELERKCFELFL